MGRGKKEPEIMTVEWSEPHLIPTTDLLKQENEKLRHDVDILTKVVKIQHDEFGYVTAICETYRKCLLEIVSYLDAPVKARSKLADIERMLR